MKTWIKAFLGISLSLMCLFTSIGYAELTTSLYVIGNSQVEPPNAIFIVDVFAPEGSNVTINQAPVNIGKPSTKVLSEVVFNGRNSSVTFDVLIMNGTDFTQYFDILEEYSELEGVGDGFSYATIDWKVEPGQGTELKPGEQKLFTVTLTYGGRYTGQVRRMLYEFDFTIDSNDLTQIVSKDITDKFEDILNNRLEENIIYEYNNRTVEISKEQTYQAVIDNMEKDSSGNYIGNLMGSDADDKALLTALFEGALTFTVGNEEVPITVMIKEKNVYGTSSSAKDMVLYITADDLGDRSTYVPVYASVYSKDDDGEWRHVGDIFSGEAQTNSYSGWPGSGSFNTETWRSTEIYYNKAKGSKIDVVIDGYEAQKK